MLSFDINHDRGRHRLLDQTINNIYIYKYLKLLS